MRLERLHDVRWRDIQQLAFSWIDTLGRYQAGPHHVVSATSVLFLLMCERFQLDPRRALEAGERVLRRAKDLEPKYPRAMAEYLEKEVRG